VIGHVLRPFLTFAFRVVPSWWRAWRESKDFVSEQWLRERLRAREF
jgi:hypothetical protein